MGQWRKRLTGYATRSMGGVEQDGSGGLQRFRMITLALDPGSSHCANSGALLRRHVELMEYFQYNNQHHGGCRKNHGWGSGD